MNLTKARAPLSPTASHAMASPAPTTEVDPEFREAVKAFIDMHDQLADAGKRLRDIRKKKRELSEVIVEYMRKNDIDGVNVRDGKLVRKQTKRLEPLKKEHILAELAKSMGQAQAEDALVNMFSKRAVTNKDMLRRTRSREEA